MLAFLYISDSIYYYAYRYKDSLRLTPIDKERMKKLKEMRDEDIDLSDMPALTQE